MKELVVRAVKFIDALSQILDRMGLHDVHQDGKAEAVGLVDQVFEIVWRAEPR